MCFRFKLRQEGALEGDLIRFGVEPLLHWLSTKRAHDSTMSAVAKFFVTPNAALRELLEGPEGLRERVKERLGIPRMQDIYVDSIIEVLCQKSDKMAFSNFFATPKTTKDSSDGDSTDGDSTAKSNSNLPLSKYRFAYFAKMHNRSGHPSIQQRT